MTLGALVTLASVILFLATFAVLLAPRIKSACIGMLRHLGVLPPAVVDFDGLLDDLFAQWPQEADERSEEEIIREERARFEALLRAA